MTSLPEIQKRVELLLHEMNKVVVGQEPVIEQILAALLCNSHALVEGYPGLAKTLIVKTLAETMDLRFGRVQGTPDLLPGDVLGTYLIDESKGHREFKFQPGPVFTNVLLMDEINRASPKTQSALLEAMQERQVTVGTSTLKLEEPFFVLATQNPIEQEGSLLLDQEVYVNGELKTGKTLLEEAEHATLVEDGKFSLYKFDDFSTFSLNASGKLEKSESYLYTYPYSGTTFHLKTASGKEITVTANHPLLVNALGEIKWKKAEELLEGDYLVCPGKLPTDHEQIELLTHQQTMQELQKKYTVVSYEDLLLLRQRSNDFTDFSSFTGKDFDALRIAATLQIHQLAAELSLNRQEYWQLLRYLRRPTKNAALHHCLSIYFSAHNPFLETARDCIDSLTPISIHRFSTDRDTVFFLAFLLSDGCRIKGLIGGTQKNFPSALDRFISILTKKIGVQLTILTQDATGCRTAKKVSAPLSDYFHFRYGIVQDSLPLSSIPSWMLRLPTDLRQEFLKTFISLEGNLRDRRIKVSQISRPSINTLSYMLLQESILPWFAVKHRSTGTDHVLKIQGKDLETYLTRIGWLDDEVRTSTLLSLKESTHSSFRTVPVPREKIIEFVQLLGMNSFHTLKERKRFLSKKWYCGYKAVKQGKSTLSTWMLQQLIDGFKEEIYFRQKLDVSSLLVDNPRYAASLCGLPLTQISFQLHCSKNQVWNLYSQGTCQLTTEIHSLISMHYQQSLFRAQQILHYLEALATEAVYYDPIRSMSAELYTGNVFGLTVPGLQNYVAGYGALGFNHNTFKLPEAQSDRFLFKVKIGYPSVEEELTVVNRYTEGTQLPAVRKVFNKENLLGMQQYTRQIPIANDIKKYALQVVAATRVNKELIEYGASPRASIGLILAGKARALLNGRKFVSKEDIQVMAYPVLRHRIILSFEADRQNLSEDDVIKQLLKK
ncbi:AAA family ATPase [Candidatus Woesearchaeota archaeon]|nr:AAA family ATPase [Candidatus Woesearchaeota archaeon]